VSIDDASVSTARDEQLLEGEPPAHVLVESIRPLANDIIAIALVDEAGNELPAWSPGAHIDLVLPSRRVRSYSLCSDPSDRSRYEIAVLCEKESLGGSIELHEAARAGLRLGYIGPRNHFELVDAQEYFFLAGGIGITPLLAMLAESEQKQVPWRCWYAGRSIDSMAFLEEVLAYGSEHVSALFENEVGLPDIAALFSSLNPGTVVYCCGPKGMIAAAEAASWRIGTRFLHLERFHPTPVPASVLSFGKAFDVRLAKSDVVLHVPADRSLLTVVRDVVPGVPSSCGSGSCGVCETTVLAGEIEHRDRVLSAEECARGDVMMICVSRAKDQMLVLDI
jgi:ferredoxin-NADP reductase